MNIKKKIAIIIAIVIIIVTGAIFITRTGSNSDISIDQILAPTATADYYADENRLKVEKGTASILRANNEEEIIESETTVNIGDTIIISTDGEATLYWFDDSISRLSGGTEITIDKADYNPENINETDIGFEVVTGEVWSKVQNLVDEDSEFLSYSGSIVAGVRGSTYNFVVKDDLVEVDSIRHAAFVGEKIGTVIDFTKTITSGSRALIDQSKKLRNLKQIMKIENISEERLEGFNLNLQKDKTDMKILNQKRVKRLKDKLGSLPGEPDYSKKMKLIDKKLESVTTPSERAELEVRIAQMHVQEAIAQMISKGQTGDLIIQIERAKKFIKESDLSVLTKERMLKELKQHITIADRILDVSPSEKELYELKDLLRNIRMELEENTDTREWLESRLIEMRLYELHDWAKYYNGFDPEQFENLAQQYFIGVERMQEFFKNNPEFQELAGGLMAELEGRPINLDMIKNLSDQFQLTQNQLQVIQDVINQMPTQPSADTINLLDVQAVPTTDIIENAPYYQGESNV